MKKSSGTPQQLEIPTFFLDRNLGKEKLPRLLRDAGFLIQVHDLNFKPDEHDNVWLEVCGNRQWVAITPDTQILKESVSMMAIGRSKGRVFFLSSNNQTSEVWANAITSAWKEIKSVLNRHRGPFVARISPLGTVWDVRELTRLGKPKKKPKPNSTQQALGRL